MVAPYPLKKAATKLGIFGPARAIWRSFNSEVRKDFEGDKRLYGQFISKGDLVFDVGANLGQKSEIFIALGARVKAFEPNPYCIPHIRKICGAAPDFELVETALGAEQGRAALHFVATASTASLLKDWSGLQSEKEAPKKVNVEMTTLDQQIRRFGVPDFCKIDVEGFEAEVLRGLSRAPKMLTFEFLRQDKDRLLECLELLQNVGMTKVNLIKMNDDNLIYRTFLSFPDFKKEVNLQNIPDIGDVFCKL